MHRLLATLLVILAGCASTADTSSGFAVAIDSTGAYPVIRSTGTPPAWSSTLLTTVGSVEGGPSEFGRVRSVLLGRNGSLYVADPSYKRLSVFDSLGAFHAQWGRDGGGPGEYRDPYSVAWLHDSLALLDPGNARIGLYAPDGTWLRSWPAQRLTGDQSIRLYRSPPDAFWVYAFRPTANGSEGLFVRYTSEGAADTLLAPRPAPGLIQAAMCNRPDGALSFFQAPFSASMHLLPTPRGERVVAMSTAYRIAFLGAAGDTLRVIERAVEPAPVSDEEWEAGLASWRKFRTDWPTAACDRTSFDRVTAKPVLDRLLFDDEGRLWVEVLTASGRQYDVHDPDGRLIATVTGLPPAGSIEPSVVAGRIALVVPDTSGVAFVQVHRIGR